MLNNTLVIKGKELMLDLSGLPTGVYTVQLTSSGHTLMQEKVIRL